MSKISDKDIESKLADKILATHRRIEKELADGLEAVEALEWLTEKMLNGPIFGIEASAYNIETLRYEMLQVQWERNGEADTITGHDFLDLYRKGKNVIP